MRALPIRTSIRTVLLALLLASSATLTTADDPIAAAVDAPDRSASDRERDARDHPSDILTFFGITPGMTVADLFAGGGYYSELIGRVVGSNGKVYLHNNAAYRKFAADALKARLAAGPPPNVVPLDAEVGALGIPNASIDLVLMSMSYHDLYFKSADWSVEPAALFADVRAILKPGGTLAIIDHVAASGTGSSAAQTLHRIDPAFARSDIESRGFKFTGSIDVLRNPADDHTKLVFDPAIRGHTDRVVYRFVRE